MELFSEVVHIVVALDVIAIAAAFTAGIVIAPIAILARRACWWRRRLKWAAVSLLASWFGLWLFLRDEKRRVASHLEDPAARSG